MLDWLYEHVRVRWLFLFAAALGVLSMFVPTAEAGTITTTVKAPTKFTDGSTITQPIKYRLEGSYDGQPLIVVTSDSITFVLQSMAAGHWCNRVFAVVNGVDSDPTDQACVTVPTSSAPPPPPSLAKKPNPAYGITTTAVP